MKKLGGMIMFLYLAGVLVAGSVTAWAGEHGGSTMEDYGATTVADNANDDAATLRQAAAELKATNPELSKKLEKMAAKQCGI